MSLELVYVFLSTLDGDADISVSAQNADAAYRKADMFVRARSDRATQFSGWPDHYLAEGGDADVHAISAVPVDVHVHEEPAWVM